MSKPMNLVRPLQQGKILKGNRKNFEKEKLGISEEDGKLSGVWFESSVQKRLKKGK